MISPPLIWIAGMAVGVIVGIVLGLAWRVEPEQHETYFDLHPTSNGGISFTTYAKPVTRAADGAIVRDGE